MTHQNTATATKIKKVSRFFRLTFQMIFIALPLFLILSWVYAPDQLTAFAGMIKWNAVPAAYHGAILHTLSIKEKSLGLVISAIPTLIQMFILFTLIKLFKRYEKGKIFSLNHVRYIRNIGYGLLVGQLIEPFYQGVMGFVLTMNNPPHHRFAAISLDQTNIGILLTAFLVILISWIMLEGCKLQDEQQLTI